ncbi:MAG: biopolymer transporter ExbD, partial [Planctomycetes bacterium]|nr:biopolymer transporter ExbD [Planctomycetota bacterium]
MSASETGVWQVRRAKGRRVYTGLSRKQVEQALRSGKLTADDLALPPGAPRWMKVPIALIYAGEQAVAAPVAVVGRPPGPEVWVPDWAPMQEEGRLIRPEAEEEDPAEMDMTPMIDVTTLLLIFFLVGGVFMLQARIELPKAKTGVPEVPAERMPVGILIDVAPDDATGVKISFEDSRDTTVLMDDIVKGYRERVEQGALPEAMLKAHRQVSFGLVRQTMAKLSEAGVQQ